MTAAALTSSQLFNMADTDFDTAIKDMSTKVYNILLHLINCKPWLVLAHFILDIYYDKLACILCQYSHIPFIYYHIHI